MAVRNILIRTLAVGLVFLVGMTLSLAQKEASPPGSEGMRLVEAVMCELVEETLPIHPAVVFSIQIGRVSCYSTFENIPEKMVIFHKWYHQDKLSTQKKLTMRSPRWSSYSSIQLRETDKGPWRVDITDENGVLLAKLRFSVTD